MLSKDRYNEIESFEGDLEVMIDPNLGDVDRPIRHDQDTNSAYVGKIGLASHAESYMDMVCHSKDDVANTPVLCAVTHLSIAILNLDLLPISYVTALIVIFDSHRIYKEHEI
jgi:hypothetical protein